jgi:hypothetical protein
MDGGLICKNTRGSFINCLAEAVWADQGRQIQQGRPRLDCALAKLARDVIRPIDD